MSESSACRLSSRALLADLVAFPSVSSAPNQALIEYIRDYLAAWGVDSELFWNAEKTKASLYASIGPAGQGGIALSGHTDVVPVDGQHWTVEPFTLSEKNGKLYGRGTADMKAFIACVLAAVPTLLAKPLQLPVHLAFSYDEEIGCQGVRPMLAQLAERPNKPRLCWIGEPTSLRPVLGHKGKLAMRCEVRGAACHSAYAPYGVNAIEYAAQLINKLGDIGRQLTSKNLRDERFDPPFSTLQTGVIHGGRALNIVPHECDFDFEVRALPDFDAQEVADQLEAFAQQILLPQMRAVHTDAAIRLQPLSAYPGLATAPDSAAAALLAQVCGSEDFGTVAFGTEGGLFAQAGIPTVVCGPGSMDQGHKPDEFISIEQVALCDAMLQRLVLHLQSA